MQDGSRFRASRFELDRNLNEGKGGAAQGFVFAKNQGQIAPYGGIGQRNSGQQPGLYLSDDIGSSYEPHADVRSHKALQKLAGIQFHGDFALEAALVKEVLNRVACTANFGQEQREAHHVSDAGFLEAAERMSRWSNDDQLIVMNIHYGQPFVIHRSGNYAEVDKVLDDRLHDLGPLQSTDLHGHAGIELLEFGKNFREDVQACTFIGPNHDLAAWNAFHFRHAHQHGLARVQGLFRILLEDLACAGERNFAAAAVKQLGANLFLQSANLRRDGGLSAKTFLRRPGKAGVPGDF